MAKRDPLTWPKGELRLDTLYRALKESVKRPMLGVTQGGSSRKFAGCESAATNGLFKTPKNQGNT